MLSTQKRFVFLLLLTTILLRLPTFFNDYYDVDELSAIVQTKQFMAGYVPGKDFDESKLPAYHALFKASYEILPDHGWVLVHILTAFIVFFTSLFIYLIGRDTVNRKTGMLAGFLYVVFISSFNRYFMATNGEIIYNLPVIISAFSFIKLLTNKKIIPKLTYLLLAVAAALIASQVKFHGIIIILIITVFAAVILPAKLQLINKRNTAITGILFLLTVLLVIFDYFVTKKVMPPIINDAAGKLFYATAVNGLQPFKIIGIYLMRQGILALWQYILWIPFLYYLYLFLKQRHYKTANISFLFVVFASLVTYLMIFAGGARLYFHYWLSSMPFVAIISATALNSINNSHFDFLRKKIRYFILVPAIFFFCYNSIDVAVKYFEPQRFIHESKISYYFRLVFMGVTNDYLMPDALYYDVTRYIKKHTGQKDKIFVWGDGACIYYFSDRLPATKSMWPKTAIVRMNNLYDNYKKTGDDSFLVQAKEIESYFISQMTQWDAELFIDTSHAVRSKLGSLSPFPYPVPEDVMDFVNKNFTLESDVDGFLVYRRIR